MTGANFGYNVLSHFSPAPAISGLLPLVDTFTDADATLITAHTPDQGTGIYEDIAGTATIDTNKAKDGTFLYPSGAADIEIEFIFNLNGASSSSLSNLARILDSTNLWRLRITGSGTTLKLFEVVDNVATTRAQGAVVADGNTDYRLIFTLNGQTVIGDFNDGERVVQYDFAANFLTETDHGVEMKVAAIRVDDLKMTAQ